MIKKVAQLLAPDSAGGTAIAPKPAAPAPPPTPAPKPAPAPSADDPFSAVDARTVPKPKPAPEPKEPAKPAANGDKEPKPEAGKDAATFKGPKELRENFERVSKERDTLKGESEALRRRLAETEEGSKKHEALAKQLAAVEKEREELKRTIGTLKFEASEDYKQKYEKPFKRQQDYAKELVSSLTVPVVDADGTQIGTQPAKWQDFADLYPLSIPEARRVAKAKFGEDAQLVVDQLIRLHQIDREAKDALGEEKEKYEARQKEEIANQSRREEAMNAAWRKVNEDIQERHPEWAADPKDPDEAQLLADSYALADSCFGDRKEMTDQQRVILDANIRHRAATQPMFVRRLNHANERIAELEAALKEKDGSGPGAVQRPTSGIDAAAKEDDIFADLRKNVPFTPGG